MRMQVAFREVPEKRFEHDMFIATGLLDVETPFAGMDEKFVNFKFHLDPPTGAVIGVECLFNPTKPDNDWGDCEHELEQCDLAHTLTMSLNRSPPDHLQNAHLLLRRTEVESSIGGTVFAFAGITYVGQYERLDPSGIYHLDPTSALGPLRMVGFGRIGTEIRPELGAIDMVVDGRGMALAQFMNLPYWGWADEPVSLPGTMRVERYREIRDYKKLFFKDDRSEAEEAEYAKLLQGLRPMGLATFDRGVEPEYLEYSRRMLDRTDVPDLTRPVTRSDKERMDEIAKEVLREILNPSESRIAAPGL